MRARPTNALTRPALFGPLDSQSPRYASCLPLRPSTSPPASARSTVLQDRGRFTGHDHLVEAEDCGVGCGEKVPRVGDDNGVDSLADGSGAPEGSFAMRAREVGSNGNSSDVAMS